MRGQFQPKCAEVFIPDALFSSGELPAAAISLYCFLAYRQSVDGATPSREEGMRALSIGRDTYAKYISLLTKAGLIRTVPTRQNGKFQSPAVLLCDRSDRGRGGESGQAPQDAMMDLPDTKKPDTVKPSTEEPNMVFSRSGYENVSPGKVNQTDAQTLQNDPQNYAVSQDILQRDSLQKNIPQNPLQRNINLSQSTLFNDISQEPQNILRNNTLHDTIHTPENHAFDTFSQNRALKNNAPGTISQSYVPTNSDFDNVPQNYAPRDNALDTASQSYIPRNNDFDTVSQSYTPKDNDFDIVSQNHVLRNNTLQDNIFNNNNYNKKSSSSSFSSSSSGNVTYQRTKKNDEVFQDLLRQYSASLSDPGTDGENEQSANYYLVLLFRKICRQLEREGEELSITRDSLLYAIEKFKEVKQKRRIYSTDRYLKTFLPSVLLEYYIQQMEPPKKKTEKKSEKRVVRNGEINRYYEDLQRRNQQLFESRRKALLEQIPQLADVQRAIAEAISQENRARLKRDTEAFHEAQQYLTQLEGEEEQLLMAYGYTKEILEPIENCPYCHDTGLLEDGTFCHCREEVKQKLQNEPANSSLSA